MVIFIHERIHELLHSITGNAYFGDYGGPASGQNVFDVSSPELFTSLSASSSTAAGDWTRCGWSGQSGGALRSTERPPARVTSRQSLLFRRTPALAGERHAR